MNQNFLPQNGFKFIIKRLPNVEFFVQEVQGLGLSSSQTEIPTPFKNLYRHGDKLQYDDLILTIRVDENIQSFKEIHDWMVGFTKPDSFTQYAAQQAGDGAYSDATLSILNSKGNANVEITFKDIFPNAISSMRFTTTSTNTDYVTTDITFKHNGYAITII